jgi:hypothetical protein
MKINGHVLEKNIKSWLWNARPVHLFSGAETKQYTIISNLERNTHYVEFLADKSPTINQVTFDLQNNSQIDKVKYPIILEGDYEVHATTRPYGDNPSKAMLGVYIPSGNTDEINNDNIVVYFGAEKLQLGVNKEHNDLESVFDFSGRLHQDLGTNWFFYGIDTSWFVLPPKLEKLDWRNDEKWMVAKK